MGFLTGVGIDPWLRAGGSPHHMADNEKGAKPDQKGPKPEAKEQKGDKKDAQKPTESKKTADYGADFRYLVRIVNTDLDGKKPFATALTYVPGVSHRLANVIAKETGIDPKARIGTLKDDQLEKVVEAIEGVQDLVPVWMLNRRKDIESGEDRHMVGSEITIMLREDLNRLKKIRSWRGHRHERKLPTRGQRTKNNGRFGGAVGVQRKDVAGAAPAEGAPAAGAPAAKAPSAAAGAAAKAAAAPAKPAAAGSGAKPLAGGKK
ncbi:MAG: 30S ribosomal protein S13 [Thermoplasmatota archaeon]